MDYLENKFRWIGRRGFPEESGSCQYIYDGLHRLTGVEKDGKPMRSYQYDTFGNRIVMEDYMRSIMTVSEYDALNRLIRQEISKDAFPEDTIQKTYTYDKRGNLTGEYQDGELMHGYAFNSMNRLEKAWDSEGREAEYYYNALGQRTSRSADGEIEEYLLDLTKPYHNLLELQKGKHRQTFYWDMNVSVMEDENRTIQYYLQDELGSPLRVLYRSGGGEAYGYDEFGADLYDSEKKPSAGRQYSRQGEHQPFGFTGYRYDDISGTYFAQAREYQPGVGRFTAEDILRGRSTVPKTLNRYGYCWGNPAGYIDVNGKDPITPQDIQKEFWESLLNAADRVVDDFAYQMDCIENDIKDAVKEGYQMVKDGVQTGLDFLGDTAHKAADFAMDTVNDGVHWVQNTLSNYHFTIAEGFDASFSPSIFQYDLMLGVACDSTGTFVLQAVFGEAVTTGTPSAAIQRYYSVTNAPSVDELKDFGVSLGGSCAIPIEEIIGAIGVDFNILGDPNKKIKYFGETVSIGLALYPGAEGHVQMSYTWNSKPFNIFDAWDKLYNKYYEHEKVNQCYGVQ